MIDSIQFHLIKLATDFFWQPSYLRSERASFNTANFNVYIAAIKTGGIKSGHFYGIKWVPFGHATGDFAHGKTKSAIYTSWSGNANKNI